MTKEEQLKITFKKILKSYILYKNTGIWGKMEGLIDEVNIDKIVNELLAEVKIRTKI